VIGSVGNRLEELKRRIDVESFKEECMRSDIRLRIGTALACMLLVLVAASGASAATNELKGIEDLFGKDWYGLYLFGGQKVGYAMTELGPTEYGGEKAYKLTLEQHMQFTMLGMKQELDIAELRIYGSDGALQYLHVDAPQPVGPPVQFLCEVVNGKFRVSRKTGQQEMTILIDIPNETLTDELAAAGMINENTKVGDSHESNIYEPILKMEETLRAKIVVTGMEDTVYNGVPTRVFNVETTILDTGLVAASKVAANGELLEERAGPLVMRLEDEALAKDVGYAVDVVVSGAIMTARLIENPRRVTKMTVRIDGLTDEELVINDERQSYSLEVPDSQDPTSSETGASEPARLYLLTVKKDNLDAVPPATVPMRAERFGSALKPSVFVQSGDERIVEQAKSIVGDEKNAVEAMKKLNRWVYRNLRKEFTASMSNALDTLERKEGDCTEHSVLFVALARAIGLPAREVGGVVYSEEGGFFFHQWAEVYVGRWVATDPTFGQPVADATHIKFTGGDILSQSRIMNVMGRLKIEIVDFEHD